MTVFAATVTLYCHEPDCAAFDGTPVPYSEGPGWRQYATLVCPHCTRPLHLEPTDERVELTLSDALRAANALLAAADRANHAAEHAVTKEYFAREIRQRDQYQAAASRVSASLLIAHARLKNRARSPQ